MGDWFWGFITGKEPIIAAGAAGGLVRWAALKERFLDGVASIGVGAICALYMSPVADPIISSTLPMDRLTTEQRVGFVGFVIGLGGVLTAGFVIDAIRAFRRKGG